MYDDENEVRSAFWAEHPSLEALALERGTRDARQNNQPADIRVAFVDFVDHLARNGQITGTLAGEVTL